MRRVLRTWQKRLGARTPQQLGRLAVIGLFAVLAGVGWDGPGAPGPDSHAAMQAEASATSGSSRAALTSGGPVQTESSTAPAAESVATFPHSTSLPDGGGSAAADVSVGQAPTVEEVLADGLDLASISPVHLAIRGTATANSMRCAWRGIARTAQQREDAVRFWLQLGPTDAIPSPVYLDALLVSSSTRWSLGIERPRRPTSYPSRGVESRGTTCS